MLKTVLLLVLFNGISIYAQYVNTKCSNNSEQQMTFIESKDVEGRYNINWCTESDKGETQWGLTLRYIENKPENKCQKYYLGMLGHRHSSFLRAVNMDLNCTHVRPLIKNSFLSFI